MKTITSAACFQGLENPLRFFPMLGTFAVLLFQPLETRATDWLLDSTPFRAAITTNANEVVLENGLVRRVIRLAPGAATIRFDNLMTGNNLLRAVRPEAVVELDGVKYKIGGLNGQPVHNYLDPRWLETMTADPKAFHFTGARVGPTVERFPWKPRREWMPAELPWPPPGKALTLSFAAPQGGVTVEVHYEIFDGLPLVSKWLTVRNGTDKPVRLNTFICELLAAVEPESIVDDSPAWRLPNLFVETDYTFGGMSGPNHSAGVHWVADPEFPTQVNYNRKTLCLLECRPPLGPDQLIAPGAAFESFRAFELVQDSTDRERQSLALRRMYRAVAPWVTENPVLMHVRSAAPEAVKLAVDQCAAVGSGFNFENRDAKYQQQIKELSDYARSKGVALGGYSLLASRGAGTKTDNTQGSPPRFGVMPCLGAQWGVDYLAQLKTFIATAGLGVLEHDGSYPGDCCAATNHPFHRGLADSQWVMWKAITEFYQWCRSQGVYLNIPDWYFLNGGTKTGMGYRETNWSLPRAYQEIIERQNIFDGTWEKTPSMGWMFVPLTQYHGGGAAATIEPLKDHLQHYEQRLANLFGAGVQACYRGPRLFDAPETEAVVKKWVSFYKQHRAILDSDLIHLRRADGQDLDYVLHVNPALKEKGLLMIYNPLAQPVSKTLTVPLYYTGLTDAARIREQEGAAKKFALDRAFNVNIPVTVPATNCTWLVIE
ncbi:MAG: hypothetical protein NTY53_10550 [Kiritimatiellaeota bacterium]|nr:hypothetical protein [Kiritimatiellota bacterium]